MMEYPYVCKLQVNSVFDSEIEITLYSEVTIFVGPNGSGKTQTLKKMRDHFKEKLGSSKVRYLSSNRLGEMEQYRSRIDQYFRSPDDYKVGDRKTKEARHEIETISGDFFAMDDKKDVYIKVAERLSVLFGRQIYLRWDAGSMKVFFEKTDNQKEYSVAVEASGLVNIISILAAIFDDYVQILLVDEPEVSLHPQLQSYLLREIKNAAKLYDKTIILSTHSAELLSFSSINDFSNLVFFEEKKVPVQINPNVPEFQGKKIKDFLLRMGQIYKNGFFAKKVLLIEGASDLIICHSLINKLELNIDVAGSQIIPVDGKGQFPVITKLFRMVNKEVAILTDLDGFIDDNSIVDLFTNLPKAIELANSCGSGNILEVINSIKTKITALVKKHKDDMEDIYKIHPYWINKKEDEDELKIAKRSLIGQLFSISDIEKWPDYQEWKSIKCRIETVLSILEKVGCFVLKKGAIESYYKFSPNTTYNEKPSAAAEEISHIDEHSISFVNDSYSDIIVALQYIATTKRVDESFAVKKELLSELALALGILQQDTTEKDIRAAIKQAKGNAVSLFEYHIINLDKKLGLKVDLKSKIIEVKGFPLTIFVGQNVNDKINEVIKGKSVE
ncbi:MAG: AAA family ATPase [Lachnospiraceae bacterium]|nr:AAA family ATPase [Lachnospiraceae bacterium]